MFYANWDSDYHWGDSMTPTQLITRYSLFALAATVINLWVQRLVLRLGTTDSYFISALFAGTLAGLLIKYLLDKHWIFYDRRAGLWAQGTQFSRYSIMGLATTAIFWGTETLFWVLWHTESMREAGAVIGLGFGYFVKFKLDRKFVFTESPRSPSA